jgi:hypothetical protein
MSIEQSRRKRLWDADPHCYWCKRVTVFMNPADGRLPDDAATLDHLYSRLNPDRDRDPHTAVLACRKCNQERARLEDLDKSRPKRQPAVMRSRKLHVANAEPLSATMAEAARLRQVRLTEMKRQQAEYTEALQLLQRTLQERESVPA